MKAIPPVTLTVVSSDVPEPGPGETEFAPGSFVVDQEVVVSADHRKYACIIAGTLSVTPKDDPDHWKDIGATNKYAMFDTLRNTGTSNPLSMTVEVSTGKRVNALAVIGGDADYVTLSMEAAGEVVWTRNYTLTLRNTKSWSQYFYGEFGSKGNRVFFDLPMYSNATITLEMTRSSGDVVCGALVVGRSVFVGKILSQASSSALNFSTVERDLAGTLTNVIPRRSVPKTDQRLVNSAASVESLRALRDSSNAVPIVWSGLDDHFENPMFEALLVLGLYREFGLVFPNDHTVEVDLSLEET